MIRRNYTQLQFIPGATIYLAIRLGPGVCLCVFVINGHLNFLIKFRFSVGQDGFAATGSGSECSLWSAQKQAMPLYAFCRLKVCVMVDDGVMVGLSFDCSERVG